MSLITSFKYRPIAPKPAPTSGFLVKRKSTEFQYRRWTVEENQAILDYLKETVQRGLSIEKPSATIYYKKFLDERHISDCNIKLLRNKVRNFRISYQGAQEWIAKTGQSLKMSEGEANFKRALLNRYPFYYDFEAVWGKNIGTIGQNVASSNQLMSVMGNDVIDSTDITYVANSSRIDSPINTIEHLDGIRIVKAEVIEENSRSFDNSKESTEDHQKTIPQENEKKRKNVEYHRWTPQENQAILDYLKETVRNGFTIEKPNANIYYSHLIKVKKLTDCNWNLLKNKVRNFRRKYQEAVEWVAKSRSIFSGEESNFEISLRSRYPLFHEFEYIWGTTLGLDVDQNCRSALRRSEDSDCNMIINQQFPLRTESDTESLNAVKNLEIEYDEELSIDLECSNDSVLNLQEVKQRGKEFTGKRNYKWTPQENQAILDFLKETVQQGLTIEVTISKLQSIPSKKSLGLLYNRYPHFHDFREIWGATVGARDSDVGDGSQIDSVMDSSDFENSIYSDHFNAAQLLTMEDEEHAFPNILYQTKCQTYEINQVPGESPSVSCAQPVATPTGKEFQVYCRETLLLRERSLAQNLQVHKEKMQLERLKLIKQVNLEAKKIAFEKYRLQQELQFRREQMLLNKELRLKELEVKKLKWEVELANIRN